MNHRRAHRGGRDPVVYVTTRVNVMHFDVDGTLYWIDPAGYVVARSPRPREWPQALDSYDFHLDVAAAVVRGAPYQPHA